MSMKRKIAVVGATGAQGGGLARAILGDAASDFEVRAITRNPDSESAKELAARGAEVVQADLDDAESLRRAFDGCYGAFLVTNFWEHFSPEKEVQQARNMAEAAASAGLEHVVWSTLEDTRELVPLSDDRVPTLQDRYKVPHFDGKGEVDAYFPELGVPTTYLIASFYWDNMIHFGMGPRRGEDGVLGIAFPIGEARMPGIGAEDIGKCAYGMFQEGKALVGRRIGIAGEHLNGREMAAALSDVIGEEVRFHAIEPDAYRGLGFPGAEDLGNMFQIYRDFEDEICRVRDVEVSRRLNPELKDFRGWLAKNGARIPIS